MFFLDKKIEKAALNRTAFSILILSSSIFSDSFRCKNLELADGIYNKSTIQLIFAKNCRTACSTFLHGLPCVFMPFSPIQTT